MMDEGRTGKGQTSTTGTQVAEVEDSHLRASFAALLEYEPPVCVICA